MSKSVFTTRSIANTENIITSLQGPEAREWHFFILLGLLLRGEHAVQPFLLSKI